VTQLNVSKWKTNSGHLMRVHNKYLPTLFWILSVNHKLRQVARLDVILIHGDISNFNVINRLATETNLRIDFTCRKRRSKTLIFWILLKILQFNVRPKCFRNRPCQCSAYARRRFWTSSDLNDLTLPIVDRRLCSSI
jgi:hypothetical protein